MKKDARERFTLRIPKKLLNQIQSNADEIGVSVNALILQILWRKADEQEGQAR